MREAETMQRYRLNNWKAFDGRAIYADFESETEAKLCAAAAGAQLYRITETGGADLIYWPGKEEGRPAVKGGGADGKKAAAE